ncbi:hypothetical protein GC163_22090 [bacterium]|nr:hypothetical protein [bacterium]
MDFAVCPACGQSVLDDDATECPFCGSSMKAQSGAKPAAPKAPAAKSPTKPAPEKKPANKSAGDDLPFDTSANIPTTVIQAARQESKGRSLKVVCPMCETVGYVPTSAAGKDVKCANPKCMVPVFNAPVPEPEPVAPPKPVKKAGNPVMLGAITFVVMAAVGAGAYLYSTRPTNEVFVKPIDLTNIPKETSPTEPTEATGSQTQTAANTPASSDPAPAATGKQQQQLIAEILKESLQTSLLSGSRNRSKPYCRRLAAEAFAYAGDTNGARQQIDALGKVGGAELKFYQASPWINIFWQERQAGKAEAATAALNAALQSTENLPKRGWDQLDIATRLAVALVLSDRIDEAQTLISAHQTTDLDGEVSPAFLWLAADPQVTSLSAVFDQQPIVARETPQAAAVAALCALRGDLARGQKFAQSWPEANVRAECLSAWAEGVVWTKANDAVAIIEPVVSDLPAPAQALVYARAARIAGALEQKTPGQALLAKGTQALEGLAAPTAVVVPGTKEIVKTRPTFDPVWQRAAMAASELAVAQWEVAGDLDQAAKWLKQSLEYTRGLGPAFPAISAKIVAADQLGATGLRNRLKTELELRTDDEARQTLGLYRRGLTDYETGAQQRFRLQTMILTRAAQAGLEAPVWSIASTQHGLEAADDREEFLGTDVALWLAERFHATGKTESLQALTAARSALGLKDLTRAPSMIYAELMAEGKYREAWNALNQAGVKSDLRESLVLKEACRQGFSATSLDTAWKAITPVTDVVLREQAVEWLSLMAARRGKAYEVWKHRQDLTSATEILSLSKGVVQGVSERLAVASEKAETVAVESPQP